MFSAKSEANEDFQAWSKDYVMFLHVTSRVYTDENHDLFGQRGGLGFPYLACLDETGHVLAQHQGPRTVDGLDATVAKAWDFKLLRKEAAAGDDDARIEIFTRRLAMEALSLEEARAGLNAVADKLSKDQLAEVEQQIVNLEIGDAMNQLRREHGRDVNEFLPAVAASFFEQGKVPNNRLATSYLDAVFTNAREKGDRELAARIVATAKTKLRNDRSGRRLIQQMNQALEDWKVGDGR